MQLRVRLRSQKVSLAVALAAVLACAAGPTPAPNAANVQADDSNNLLRTETCAPNASTLESAVDSTEVDKPARARPGGPYPQYPLVLREHGIQGTVRLLFVVDTLGRAEMCTVRVVVSTDELFTQAVLDVLPRVRFFPAERDGQKVRQRLELPWEFRIGRPRP